MMKPANGATQQPGARANDPNKLVLDATFLLFNVASSTLIIMVNKHLMRPDGLNYRYATTLCAMHFLTCALYTSVLVMTGSIKKVAVPFKDLWSFAAVAALSIASLNLSLMLNTVGVYQMSKLLIVPFIALCEFFWYQRRFTGRVIAAMCCVVGGVGMLTVTGSVTGDDQTMLGVIMAATSVVSSGLQQLLCRHVQKVNNISSQELLAASSPLQGMMLLVMGPFIDKLLSRTWVTSYNYSTAAFVWIGLSCVVAIGVNLSQFLVLGRFTAVTFSIMGHLKTLLVLAGGFLLFGEPASMKQLAAMGLAITGMIWYGVETSKPAPSPEQRNPVKPVAVPESRPLLEADKGTSAARKDVV